MWAVYQIYEYMKNKSEKIVKSYEKYIGIIYEIYIKNIWKKYIGKHMKNMKNRYKIYWKIMKNI